MKYLTIKLYQLVMIRFQYSKFLLRVYFIFIECFDAYKITIKIVKKRYFDNWKDLCHNILLLQILPFLLVISGKLAK